jgi:hypothetical protein
MQATDRSVAQQELMDEGRAIILVMKDSKDQENEDNGTTTRTTQAGTTTPKIETRTTAGTRELE